MMELLVSFQNALRAVFKTVQREQIKSDDIVLATDKNLLEDKSFSKLHDGHNVRIVRRSA